MILEVRDLSIGYRKRVVGKELTFAVRPGEVVALLGPNGGGKTTLLKTVLGLIPPLAGEIRLGGDRLSDLSVGERARRAAYVPQVHTGVFAFSVEDVVLIGRSARSGLFAGPSARDREVALGAIERLGIAHLAERPYTQISGGERQLALIARALAQEPRVVIFDEPTASLDFGNQGKVMREIRRLAADGLGVVFSTHDPNHALRHADRALLIRNGATLAWGPSGQVITQEILRELYGAEIIRLGGSDAGVAYLPD
jgi:iron complex transport system ATP-binding protein